MSENRAGKRIEVGILGATGMVGQQFIRFLEGHPWFEVKWIGASDRSAGRKYREATKWRLDGDAPDSAANLTVQECKPGKAPRLIFSAMDASVATEIEREFAKAGHFVVSNSKNHRMERDVPLLIPEINPDHLKLLARQTSERGWSGQIVTNPNCSTVVLSMALAPVMVFGVGSVVVTTMQAISGAGYPGVAAMDITNNVIPFIGEEEQKMERETQKILGTLDGGEILPLAAAISAQCNRVPVVNGHTMTVSVSFTNKPTEREVLAAFEGFSGPPQQRHLPSAPVTPILYLPEGDRPQPARDAGRERGMTVTIGRLRSCPVLDYKFVALGHNTIRGAAGAAVLNAELIYSEGLLDR
jgi:aspartate-semialdehyde dehydrogenase